MAVITKSTDILFRRYNLKTQHFQEYFLSIQTMSLLWKNWFQVRKSEDTFLDFIACTMYEFEKNIL